MSKKNTLVISLAGTFLFIAFLFAKNLGLCVLINYSCTETFDPVAEIFIVFIPLLCISVMTYKMRDEVYKTWFQFARWWIPLSMFLILLAPEYSHDWMFSYEKGTVAFFSSLLFVIISVVLIILKYLTVRKNRAL